MDEVALAHVRFAAESESTMLSALAGVCEGALDDLASSSLQSKDHCHERRPTSKRTLGFGEGRGPRIRMERSAMSPSLVYICSAIACAMGGAPGTPRVASAIEPMMSSFSRTERALLMRSG